MSTADSTAWISYESAGKTVRVELDQPRTVFGRDPRCEVTLNFNPVSRSHFAIERENGEWFIEDLESRNGTFVNKYKITRQQLNSGDRINIGRQSLVPIVLSFFKEVPSSPSVDDNVVFGDDETPSSVAAHISVDQVNVRPPVRPEEGDIGLGEEAPGASSTMMGSVSTGLISMFSQVGDVLLHSASLKDTLQRVLDLAFDNMPAHRGAICLYDPTTNQIEPKASRRGKSTAAINISRHVAHQVISNKRAILVNDVGGDERFSASQSIAQMNISSVMAAPMVHRGEVQGLIYVDTTGGEEGFLSEPFDEAHLESLAAIGVFAAAAIEKIKLEKGIQLLLDVARSLSSELDMDKLVHLIIDHAREFLDAEVGRLYLVEKEHNELVSKVPDGADTIYMKLSEGVAGHVASTGEILNISDAQNNPRVGKKVDQQSGVTTRNVLCIPLRDRETEIFGVAELINKRGGDFDDADQQMMEAFSAQAAVALQNSLLFNETVETQNYLQSVLKSIDQLVLTLNTNGQLVTANDDVTPVLGLEQRDMERNHYDQWFKEGENEELIKNLRRVFKRGEAIFVTDYEITTPEKTVSANYNIVPMLDVEETQTGVVMVFDDITDHKRAMGSLSRHLGPAIAQKVMEESEAVLGGVKQEVTVLFSDIRGYTTLTESLGPTEVVAMLNEYFTVMVDEIFGADGVLDKFIGDAIMATFGVPFANEEGLDATNACKAALGMTAALKELNAAREQKQMLPILMGVGVNTGEAVTGNIGSEKQFEYTCIGDSVNLASRLEGVTKPYGVPILISQSTYQAAGHQFVTRELDNIRVKGKQEPIAIYELIATNKDEAEPEFVESLPLFEQGLSAYRSRDFAAATEAFNQVLKLRDGDAPAKIFIDRCRHFTENPPPADWDGIYEMTTK